MASPIPAAPHRDSAPRMPEGPSDADCIEDRYRSLLFIGRGGMGTVEVALERAEKGAERVVALKRLLPEGARDPRHKEMFLREARLAALLAHPNVAHAFAYGDLRGELFIAMEYVEGEPLSHVLRVAQERDGGLAPVLVARVLAQVCDGLHAAHELRDDGGRGQPLHVVHRDVSPHNVMIAYEGRVKLLDFGVAKFETGGNESRTGEVKGKMAYMSPEQALGERLDRRSDLFSVGAVLFECLTGGRMWGSGTDMEVMRKLALESPPQLDVAMPNAPRTLVDLHARLVSRDPVKRPATAHEVAEELRAFAASSTRRPDAETAEALMQRLFGAQAERRRRLLRESLEHRSPAAVAALEDGDRSSGFTSRESLVLRSAPRQHGLPQKSTATLSLGIFLLALLGAVVAASAAMRRSQSTPGSEHVTTPPIATSTPMSTATSTSTSTVSPVPVATASSPNSRNSAAAPSLLARPRSSGPAPTTAPTKLPDVDPTPF